MQGGGLFLQPQVELCSSELIAQEVLDFRCVLDLPLLIVELLQGLIPPPVRAEELKLRLLDLDRQCLHLMAPFGCPAIPARLCHVDRGG